MSSLPRGQNVTAQKKGYDHSLCSNKEVRDNSGPEWILRHVQHGTPKILKFPIILTYQISKQWKAKEMLIQKNGKTV